VALKELVPAYLPAVPLDPFAAEGATLRYRREGDRPVVYSVGLDGHDAGGSERPRPEVRHPEPPLDRWQCVDAVMHLARQPRVIRPPENRTLGGGARYDGK
jgi:hypothetical protein